MNDTNDYYLYQGKIYTALNAQQKENLLGTMAATAIYF